MLAHGVGLAGRGVVSFDCAPVPLRCGPGPGTATRDAHGPLQGAATCLPLPMLRAALTARFSLFTATPSTHRLLGPRPDQLARALAPSRPRARAG